MSQIEVPDWVVDEALAARLPDGSSVRFQITTPWEMTTMRAALTAALGAWVVPGGYQSRLIAKRTGKLVNDWREVDKELFDAVGGQPHEGRDFRCEYRTLYDLRQEKPE